MLFQARTVAKHQPEGPYYLGGMCFGCSVAFEISQQLHKAGCSILLLCLLDPGSPRWIATNTKKSVYSQVIGYAYRIIVHIERNILTPVSKKNLVIQYRCHLRMTTKRILEQARRHVTFEKHRTAWKNYKPCLYQGTITLPRSSEYDIKEQKNDGFIKGENWSNLTEDDFVCHVIQGTHQQVLGDGPQHLELLKKFKTCLDKAQQDNAAAHTS
ncbi:MAG: hypothetical protein D3911_02970 [Candidatus Electrothrix sp. AW3_4]|nr:hypothetical protein [Candidatus Electrothrix gigas]